MTTTMKKSPVLQDDQKFALMKVCILNRYRQWEIFTYSINSSERKCISNSNHFACHNLVCDVRPPKNYVILNDISLFFLLDCVEVEFSHFFLACADKYVLQFAINGHIWSVCSDPRTSLHIGEYKREKEYNHEIMHIDIFINESNWNAQYNM